MYDPLPIKELSIKGSQKELVARVLFFDPSEVYARIAPILDTYKRFPTVPITKMFPQVKGVCGCGCGAALTGRRTRWSTDDCSRFASIVWAIISGRPDTIGSFLERYYGRQCYECGTPDKWKISGNPYRTLQIDHTIPVKHGGGGCWLSGYKFLCPECHRNKTNKDFGWKAKTKTIKQPTLFEP